MFSHLKAVGAGRRTLVSANLTIVERVVSLTSDLFRRARDTVFTETPAFTAMSCKRTGFFFVFTSVLTVRHDINASDVSILTMPVLRHDVMSRVISNEMAFLLLKNNGIILFFTVNVKIFLFIIFSCLMNFL